MNRLACIVVALGISQLRAQVPVAHPPVAEDAVARDAATCRVSRTAGLHLLDGQLWGSGDTYKVRFDPDGFEYTPVLGRRAPRDYPLTFRLASIDRGSAPSPLALRAPTFRGLRVEYDRGVAVERYDIGVDAVEQSFVFDVLPAGTGDLVVRGRLTTDMVVSPEGDGLRFELPGVGGFRMGGVVGIDANGVRAQGRVHYADGEFSLSLPAAFVDRATLPLVLDPPLSGAFVISGTGGSDDEAPLVSYDASTDRYLVIWTRFVSAANLDVNGHLVSRAALPIGSRILIESSSASEDEPQIANCDVRNAFVIVYTRTGDILARSVNAATAAVSASTFVAGGGGVQRSGAVAGDRNNPQVVCVWQSDGDLTLQSSRMVVNADLTLAPGIPRIIASGANQAVRPRISKSDHGTGRHALVFQRELSAGANSNPSMLIVDANGVPISSELTLSNSAVDEEKLEVDGDGSTWVVGWLGLGFLNAPAAFAASISFDARSRTFVTNTPRPLDRGYRSPTPPSVTWIGDSVLFGFSSLLSTNPSLREALVVSCDPFLCGVCEPFGSFGEFPIGSNTRVERTPFACAAASAGGTAEDVLMAWPQNDVTSTNTDIIIRRWQAVDGGTVSLGGGCGEGGTNRATCARSPNRGFTHRLRDSIPSAPTVFLVAGTQLGLQCGPCTLVPNPAEIALVLNTDASGEVAVPAAIPASSHLIGVPLFTQWATIDLATPACTLFPIDLSNALRVLIQ